MKRRTTFLAAAVLFVVVGSTACVGTRTLTVQVPAEAKRTAPPTSVENTTETSHFTSGDLHLTWDRYEEVLSDPDVWHLRVSYRLYDDRGVQIGYQSLVSKLRPAVDEPGSGDFTIDDVRPTWPDLEPAITYTVWFSASWESAYHDNIGAISTTLESDADGYYPFDAFQIYEWYDDCPVDPPTSTPRPIQETLTPRPTLTPEPTPTCDSTATAEPTEVTPTPYPTMPPLPTATEYPDQPE